MDHLGNTRRAMEPASPLPVPRCVITPALAGQHTFRSSYDAADSTPSAATCEIPSYAKIYPLTYFLALRKSLITGNMIPPSFLANEKLKLFHSA